MPPFTYDPKELFAAIVKLANDRDQSWRRTKKGDKRPWYDVEAQKASRKRNIKARQEAATERSLAKARARNSTARPAGEDIASRILKAMQPGAYYGMGDLVRMIGESRSSRSKVIQLWRQGAIERARNPAWSGVRLNPLEIMGGKEPQPETLYRLTEAGLQKRNNLLASTTRI